MTIMDKADILAQECSQALKGGAEYSEIWEAILRRNDLVASPPIQHYDEDLSHTDVLLNTGFWLRYCADTRDFTLRRARQRRPF